MSDDGNDDLDGLKGDDRIIAEAKKRFRKCEDWEADARQNFVQDLKFVNADADNGYQWPDKILTDRQTNSRPSLTINKTRQHCLMIINDAKKNKPSVNIRPVGNGATFEAAQTFEGVCRHIEYISNAEAAYDHATTFQVQCGIGYWRVITDYASEDDFDQEIFIRPVKDPRSVFLDPDIKEADGSDARYGFVFDDMPKDLYDLEFPKDKDGGTHAPLGSTADGWVTKDYVRVAEYYRVREKKDLLLAVTDPDSGQVSMIRRSKIPPELRPEIMADPATRKREVTDPVVEWFKIGGDKILDRTIFPCRYIPLVRVIGEETVIDGVMDRKGHTRALIDPQRMYNYMSSAAVEFGALQSKTPWVAPVRAIEGYVTYWETANTVNHSILPYNDRDDTGKEIAAPRRQEPPVSAPAFLDGMKVAANEMMMVSGQYEANMGQKSNEVSGKAINERQRQGDTATYHYIDNLAMAIRFTGKILVDLIPKVYDTKRVIRIMAEDGTPSEVMLDPNAKQAYVEQQAKQNEEVKAIFNPNVGRYDVEADVGPGYATRRQEAWNAFVQIVSQNKELMPLIGDIMFQNADFPGADEISARLRRMIPPQASGEGPPPQLAQAQQQIQGSQKAIESLVQQLAEAKLSLKAKDADMADKTEQKAIDWEYAITDRLKVLLPTIVNPAEIARMVHDLAMQEHASNNAIMQTSHEAILNNAMQPEPETAQQPEMAGA